MSIQVYDSGTDKEVQEVYAQESSTDKEVDEVIVHDSGTDKTAYEALPNVDENTTVGTRVAEGGYMAGTINYDSTDYIIIISPSDGGQFSTSAWSPNTSTFYGATDNWDGVSNTNEMILDATSLSGSDATGKINDIQTDGLNGYNDWYIGSKRENKLIYNNIANADMSGTDWASNSESIDETPWSSTENDSSNTDICQMNNGSFDTWPKTWNIDIRVIRRISY